MTDVRHDIAYEMWFQKQMNSFGSWEWSDTGVDVILTESGSNDDVTMKKMVDFFMSIDAPHLREGSITKLFGCGISSIEDVILASEWTMSQVLGANGTKAHAALHNILSDIPLYKLMGAYANERGLGVRKIKKLQMALGEDAVANADELTVREIESVDGFDTKTANKVIKAGKEFKEFMKRVDGVVTINHDSLVNTDGVLADKNICMTGFRDKTLAARIEELGGTVQSGVSGKTSLLVVADTNTASNKAKKARDLGIEIMSVADFKDMIEDA